MDDKEIISAGIPDDGRLITTNMILEQYEALSKNKEYQKLFYGGFPKPDLPLENLRTTERQLEMHY